MADWYVVVFGAVAALAVWKLHTIDQNLRAILFIMRHQAGLNQEDEG